MASASTFNASLILMPTNGRFARRAQLVSATL